MTQPVFTAETLEINPLTGNQRKRRMALSMEAKPLYDAMIEAGCHFESESISGARVTTINNGEKDIAIRTTESGGSVEMGIIDMLVGEPWK